jgi:hypothetical protein
MKTNPKTHDSLFKWLITSFTEEFFSHYFPNIRIGAYTFIDKEFISRYEALKQSLEGDLFLAMEVGIDGEIQEIVIQIEHQSDKKDISERVYRYSCYAWLLKEKPVWSIVIYTDEAVSWQSPLADTFCYGFHSRTGKQFHRFDLIRVKAEKSNALIQKKSMLCKLLALQADDREADAEGLLREIYRAAAEMKEKGILDDDGLLLLEQWVNVYTKAPAGTVGKIREETKMTFTATTISEHIRHEGRREGRREGRYEGRHEGEIRVLENLYRKGILSKAQYDEIMRPLLQKQAVLKSRRKKRALKRKPDGESDASAI